jgi:hypothetical protein
LRQDLPHVRLEILPAVAEQVRRGGGGREHPGHDVIYRLLDGSLVGHGHRLRGQEPDLPEHLVLAAG